MPVFSDTCVTFGQVRSACRRISSRFLLAIRFAIKSPLSCPDFDRIVSSKSLRLLNSFQDFPLLVFWHFSPEHPAELTFRYPQGFGYLPMKNPCVLNPFSYSHITHNGLLSLCLCCSHLHCSRFFKTISPHIFQKSGPDIPSQEHPALTSAF